ncbi:MAG: phosphoribosyl transferase [Dehalococcoidales bacterium]|nr:phosphoribosyl transferase [Dehalococcoidales bacterium]
MRLSREAPLFENRYDAGRQLAEKLSEYRGQPVVVLAIPNGGLPVGLQVALELGVDLDVVISRKLPLPLRPEGGFGAIADDGAVILNEALVKDFDLTPEQISYEVNKVRLDIRQRSLLYRGNRLLATVGGKTVIITDDGLASGYTMMAAVESVRRRRPAQVVVAVPAASGAAVKQLEKVADRVVTCVTGFMPRFYVSDFYRYWHVLSDDEGLKCLKEWRLRRFGPKIEPQPEKPDDTRLPQS